MRSDEDSLTRLIEDVDAAAAGSTCQYFGEANGGTCSTSCPAYGSGRPCVLDMLEDAAHRLHALMPHDMDGREIKVGDTIKRVSSGLQIHVTDVISAIATASGFLPTRYCPACGAKVVG